MKAMQAQIPKSVTLNGKSQEEITDKNWDNLITLTIGKQSESSRNCKINNHLKLLSSKTFGLILLDLFMTNFCKYYYLSMLNNSLPIISPSPYYNNK
jgi:hypothetical protein